MALKNFSPSPTMCSEYWIGLALRGLADQLAEPLLALGQRQFAQILAVVLQQIESEIGEGRAGRERILQRREIGAPVLEGDDFAVDQRSSPW